MGVTYFGLTTMINNGYDATLSAQLGGFDPLMLMGLSTLGMMAVGWLVGPVFGNMVFNLAYRGVVGEFTRVCLKPYFHSCGLFQKKKGGDGKRWHESA